MHRTYLLPVLLIAAAIAVGCSGSSGSPILPGGVSPDLTGSSPPIVREPSSKAVWGVWEITIDSATWEASIVPIRGAEYTVDVVTFLQKPAGDPANLGLKVTEVDEWLTQGLITCEVSLRHPFPGLDLYTGFDVLGVFMAPGSLTGNYDSDVAYTNGADEGVLLNADGYTRWMNPAEFPDAGTILDFTPGNLGTPDIGLFTSTINAYKYFADGLEKDQAVHDFFTDENNARNRGMFRPGSVNWRTYDLKFPMVAGSPYLVFQYAVVASWVEPDTTLSGDPEVLDIPSDFPVNANAAEAVNLAITDESTVYNTGSWSGGSIILDLEVYDWGALQSSMQVLDEIHQIVVESSSGVIPGAYVAFDKTALGATAAPGSSIVSSVFEIEIADLHPESNADIPLLITIESEAPDTFDPGTGTPNNDDRLASYFTINVPVSETPAEYFKVTSPNGGEIAYIFMSYEITWESYDPTITEVAVEYSTDDFVSDINTIVGSTENDGSFVWDPIPKVLSYTAKVRVKSVDGSKYDDSDDYFFILPPVWLDFQDPVSVNASTVSFNYVAYLNWDELSPAISQDRDGPVHICWHDEIAHAAQNYREARDVVIRSSDGDSWTGEGGFLFTGGGSAAEIHELRRDYMKLAPAANNTTFAAVWHWSIYFSLDVDHWINGHSYYNAYTLFNRIYKAEEIMADDDYLYLVSDGDQSMGDGPGIYSYRFNTPNYMWAGWPGSPDPIPTMNTLTPSGEISHSRSWAFQDDLLVMAYYTNTGQIKLLRQVDYAGDVWDDSEVIFDGSGYSGCKNPALCFDANNRLFAVWTGKENSSGDYQLLVSRLDSPTDPWSAPMVIASAAGQFDDQHITAHDEKFELPDGTMEDLLLVGYDLGKQVHYQIILLDMWDWLPAMDVSDSDDIIRDPDTMCLGYSYNYDALMTWSYEILPGSIGYGDYDIMFINGDFVIPQ